MMQRFTIGSFLLAALLAVPGCGGPGEEDSASDHDRRPPNIILVSIDSLRADHVGSYGYPQPTTPFIDSLAAGGVRFDNVVSTTSWTLPAHAALFTGLYDSTHGVVDNGLRLGEGYLTLAEILREQGYHTAGFYGGPYLHPTFGMAQGFDLYQSCMTTTPDAASDSEVRDESSALAGASHVDVTGPRTLAEVTRWAERAPAQPYFLFLHLWDVHYDYIPPAGYVELFDPDYEGDLTGRQFTTNPRLKPDIPARDLAHLIALYDGEIRFTDEILRKIFGELGARGLLDDTLIVITSDHGEEFFEHGGKGHQLTLFDEVLRVPLILHWPGRLPAGRVIGDQVRLVDLLPTLAFHGGFEGELPIQGRNIDPLVQGGTMFPAPALAELLVGDQTMRALRTNESKLLRMRDDWGGFLFKLDSDPGERAPVNRDPRHEPERIRLEAELNQTVDRARKLREALAAQPTSPTEIDPDLRDRLRSLGYL